MPALPFLPRYGSLSMYCTASCYHAIRDGYEEIIEEFHRGFRRSNMSKTTTKKASHRNGERYYCPPFFSVRIDCGGRLEEKAAVEDLSLRGLKVRTSEGFEKGADADIELKSTYAAPVRIRARVAWVAPSEDEQYSHVVGFSISKIRIVDWFRFMRIISQIKKEVW